MNPPVPKDSVVMELQICAQTITQNILDGKHYSEAESQEWCNEIVRQILTKLKENYRFEYKFVAKAMILFRKTGLMIDTQMALWDIKNDVRITTKWANETIQCIVSIWGFKTKHSSLKNDQSPPPAA